MLNWFFMLALLLASLVLILLILVQRGKGGGLAGALGGMGGQSAFGAKAGDTFTRITIVVAVFWIALCIGAVATLKPPKSRYEAVTEGGTPASSSAPASTDTPAPATTDTGGEKASDAKPAEKPAK